MERSSSRLPLQLSLTAVASYLYVVVGLRLVIEAMEGRPLARALSTAIDGYARDVGREPILHLCVVAAVVAYTAFAIGIASRTRRIVGFGLLLAPALLLTGVVVTAELNKEEEPTACCALPPEYQNDLDAKEADGSYN